jgi:predicted amidohydrolase
MSGREQAPPPYLAAAIQFEPEMFATERNIARLTELTEEAARAGAKLIVHPEMATTGYCWASRAEIASEVEPIPGPTTARFGAIAAQYGCYIVVALPEVVPVTGVYYNSAALVGPSGVVGVYRKTHSYISEPKWAKDGDLGLPVFETELGRIAISICMDAVFPETGRVPALEGADVICFPTNWLSEKSPSPTWMARALENGVYFLAANRYGLERGVQFSGGSCVIDPDGTIQAAVDDGDGIAYGTIDIGRARDKRWSTEGDEDKLADRRPDAYGDITLSTYRWQDREFHGLYGIDPLPEGRRSRIAACQFAPVAGDIDGNLHRIELFAAQHSGAGLVVLPELATCGPIESGAAARLAADRYDEVVEHLSRCASWFGNYLVAGLVESDGDRLFNAAVLIGPAGRLGSYRKVHLTANDEIWATPGERLVTIDIPAGRIGLLIGYDATFPEATTCLALNGADLIACPSLVSGPPVLPWGETSVPLPPGASRAATNAHFHLWRERARETWTTVAFANGGAPAMGWSAVFDGGIEDDHSRQILLEGDGDGSVTLELDTTNLDTRYKTNPIRAKDIVAMRMPIWYDALQRPRSSSRQVMNRDLLVSRAGDD